MDRGRRVEAALAGVDEALVRLEAALDQVGGHGLTREGWLDVVGGAQEVVNRAVAVQDRAIAAASRFESTYAEDGTVASVERGAGRVALDAADLVAPRLGVSHHQAQQRVESAVRLTGRVPVPVESGERPRRSGLGGLHASMRAGRLDGYRARVVADELLEAPAEVAAAVVEALDPHLAGEPGPGLRRRTRRLLARISPDLLAQRAQRARTETGLRRWVAEPGVDAWYGTFPSEQSAAAWAAVDRLARRLVTEGACATIDQARGRALTDLVLQQADVRVQLVLTTPADTACPTSDTATSGVGSAVTGGPDRMRAAPTTTADDLVQIHGTRPSEPVLVPRSWLGQAATDETTDVLTQPCHRRTGAPIDPSEALARDGYRPSARLSALVKARDGRCRFPGCAVSARFCDLDHARPWPAGPTTAANLLCLCRRHHRIKQSPGWTLRLQPDGIAHWSDPTGTTTSTEPLDALEQVVLHTDPTHAQLQCHPAPARTRPELPSVLEEAHEHRLDHHHAVRRHRRRSNTPDTDLMTHHRTRRGLEASSGDPPF